MIIRVLPSSIILMLTLLFVVGCTSTEPASRQANAPLILISIDGARHDYIDRFHAPHLQAIAQQGTRADYLQPVFPSKTFPNHYSLVTGLRPERHGIVNNNMYDPEFKAVFSLGKREEVENPRWWGGEPIWVTSEKQGVKAATFFFPGSETAIQNTRPSYWYSYDGSIENRTRVEQVLAWLDLPAEERPQLITLYFSDVDTAGHHYGPNSAEVEASFKAIDAEIGFLLAGLAERGLSDKVNLMITSDHGMQEVNPHQHFVVDGHFDADRVEKVVYSRETISVYPKQGQTDVLYQQLSQAIPASFGQVLRKDDMPERFQYTNNQRIADIVLLANPGKVWAREAWLEQLAGVAADARIGTHGYDNEHSNMFGMFIAKGPAFKTESRVAGFEMVDVYQVMAKILGVKAATHQGNPAVIPLLLESNEVQTRYSNE